MKLLEKSEERTMETLAGLRVDETNLPEGALLIEFGNGPVWDYSASGIKALYVRGGCFETRGYEGWVHFTRLQALHDKIGDALLERPLLNGDAFRFLRKEMALTVSDVAEVLGRDTCDLNGWQAGGFAVADAEVRKLYTTWRKTRVRPRVTSRAVTA